MAKKKLQLSEIKVKSLVSLVEPSEQKTAKGGYVNNVTTPVVIININDRNSWTELKTRVSKDVTFNLGHSNGKD